MTRVVPRPGFRPGPSNCRSRKRDTCKLRAALPCSCTTGIESSDSSNEFRDECIHAIGSASTADTIVGSVCATRDALSAFSFAVVRDRAADQPSPTRKRCSGSLKIELRSDEFRGQLASWITIIYGVRVQLLVARSDGLPS